MTTQTEELLSPAGTEVLALVAEAREAGEAPLATAARLRRDYPAGLVAAATAQDELRVAGRAKFSRAARMLFTRAGLEQASSETAARHRAARLAAAAPGRLADLGCGIGGDLIALAAGREVLAVDRDPDHLLMAAHNAGVYDVATGLTTRESDVRDVPLAGLAAVFADPARRRARTARGPARGAPKAQRLRPGDSEPPLDWCFALAGPGTGRGAQGRARAARRYRSGRLGDRVRGRRARPQGGRAVVTRPGRRAGPGHDPARR